MTEIQPKQARLKKSFAFASLALAIVAGTSTFFYTHSGSESKQPTVAQIINANPSPTMAPTSTPKELDARMYVAQQLQELTGAADINEILNNASKSQDIKPNTILYEKVTYDKARDGDPTGSNEIWMSRYPLVARKDIAYLPDNSMLRASISAISEEGGHYWIEYHNDSRRPESANGLNLLNSFEDTRTEAYKNRNKEIFQMSQKGGFNLTYELRNFIEHPEEYETNIKAEGSKVNLILTKRGSFVDEQFRPTDIDKKVFEYTFEDNKVIRSKSTYYAGDKITFSGTREIKILDFDPAVFTQESLNLPANTKIIE